MNKHDAENHKATNPARHDQILEAVDALYNAQSTNDLRRQASSFLEQIRDDDNAPEQGFILASARDQAPPVRYYGLSLISHAIHYRWADFRREQNAAVREWILKLANETSDEDPSYVTNKIAELWVETAKRSWAVDWMDMDERLVSLWEGHKAQKMMVLNILETLSEEIFTTEDSVAALRGNDLNRACIDIFIPAQVLTEQFPRRENSVDVRYGTDGWISRLSSALHGCATQTPLEDPHEGFALKLLSAFKSSVTWIIPKALIVTQSIERICSCLAVSSMPVQLVSVPHTNFLLWPR